MSVNPLANQASSAAGSSSDFDIHALGDTIAACALPLRAWSEPESEDDRHACRVRCEGADECWVAIVKVGPMVARMTQRGQLEAGTVERSCQASV